MKRQFFKISVRIESRLRGEPAFHNLTFEPTRKHLVGLVKAYDLDLVRYQHLRLEQVKQPAGRAHNDVNALPQCSDIPTNISPSNTSVASDFHIFSNLEDYLLCLLCQLSSRRKYKSLSRFNRDVQLKGLVEEKKLAL